MKIQRLRNLAGNVEDTVGRKRPAIIDSHYHGVPVAQISDPRVAGERQSRVSGRNGVSIVDLAVGSAPTVEGITVPRRKTSYGVMLFARIIGPPRNCIGFPNHKNAAAPRHGLAIGDNARTCRAIDRRRKLLLGICIGKPLRPRLSTAAET
jgi:hypothetical protein